MSCKLEIGKWYKHRGDFAFVYIQSMNETYDGKHHIVKYMWIGELQKKDGKSMFVETSEFTTASDFHKSLYLIKRPDLIPPPNIVAKCKLLIKGNNDYADLYPNKREPNQVHPWKRHN